MHVVAFDSKLLKFFRLQFRVAVRLTPNDWYDVYSTASSIIATQPGGLPTSPPKILTATAVSSSVISVIWEEGQFINGPVSSYILQIGEQAAGNANIKVKTEPFSFGESNELCFDLEKVTQSL